MSFPLHATPLRRAASVAVALGLVWSLGACSDEKSPEEQRRDRVENRLKETFTDVQAQCLIERFDESTLVALDEGSTLAGDDLEAYSATVEACVVDADDTAEPEATQGSG